MGAMSGVEHSLQSFRSSCDEELHRVEREIWDNQRWLSELMEESTMYKIFKGSKYRQRKAHLEKTIEGLEARKKELQLELRIYSEYGLNIPENHPERERFQRIIEARDNKLDIILLVEMGMM